MADTLDEIPDLVDFGVVPNTSFAGADLLGRLDTNYAARQPNIGPSLYDYGKAFASGAGSAIVNLPSSVYEFGKAALPYAEYLIPVYGQYRAGQDLGTALKSAEADRALKEQTATEYYTPIAKKATEIGVRGGAQIAGGLGGAAVGGLAGIETGPGAVLTSILGAGTGASAADVGAKQLLEYLGISEPTSGLSKAEGAGETFALGGLGEAIPAFMTKLKPIEVNPQIKALAGKEGATEQLVTKELLSRMTPEEIARVQLAQETPQLAMSPTRQPLTLAEITQSPAVAQYQQNLMSNTVTGRPLLDALASRQQAVEAGLKSIGVETQVGEMAKSVQDAAVEAGKQKAAKVGSLAEGLGITPEIKELTKLEKGEAFVFKLQQGADDAYKPVQEAWRQVSKDAKIDVAPQLNEALDLTRNYGELTKKQISPLGRELQQKVEQHLLENDGLISVGDYQDMLGTANYLLREGRGTIGEVERGFISRLKRSLMDLDPTGVNSASEPLQNAIAATRAYRQKYSQGVVGTLLETRGGEAVKQASNAVKEALKSPENAREIVQKFGRNSVESLTLRADLMTQLDAAKNPLEFINRHKDLFKIFEDDLAKVQDFAKAKQAKTGLEQFATITDAAIPRNIFNSEEAAKDFITKFKNSDIELMARRKYVDALTKQRGNPIEKLGAQQKIAQQILGADYDKVLKLLQEIEQLKVPGQLERAATGKESITFTRGTAFLKLMQERGLLNFLSKRGAQVGAAMGAVQAGWVGAVAGSVGGAKLAERATGVIDDVNRLAADLVANPRMLKLATEPAAEANVSALAAFAEEYGYLGKATPAANLDYRVKKPDSAPIDWSKQLEANPSLLDQIPDLLGSDATELAKPEETPTVKVGKQNISIPVGEEFAPADLVKAVIRVESAGKKDAVSPKGARGLMQLMPGTAKQMGVRNSFDPQQNIEGGSKYLNIQLNEFEDPKLALAAYNWGPANVKKYIRFLEQQGIDPTWENIVANYSPPAETRNYVKKVMSFYA